MSEKTILFEKLKDKNIFDLVKSFILSYNIIVKQSRKKLLEHVYSIVQKNNTSNEIQYFLRQYYKTFVFGVEDVDPLFYKILNLIVHPICLFELANFQYMKVDFDKIDLTNCISNEYVFKNTKYITGDVGSMKISNLTCFGMFKYAQGEKVDITKWGLNVNFSDMMLDTNIKSFIVTKNQAKKN